MDNESDKLVQACIKGDKRAQHQLYEQFKVPMFGVCLRYASSRDEAEDWLQDGFIQVFTDLYQYRPIGPLGGWIRTVIVNVCLQHIRRRKNIFFVEVNDIRNEYSAQENIFSELGKQELMRMLQQLPDGYRIVFNLFAIEGYSHKEIADMLGINEGTSKSQFARAKAQLQSMVLQNASRS